MSAGIHPGMSAIYLKFFHIVVTSVHINGHHPSLDVLRCDRWHLLMSSSSGRVVTAGMSDGKALACAKRLFLGRLSL